MGSGNHFLILVHNFLFICINSMSVSSIPIARTRLKPEKALAFGQNAFQPQINNRQHLFGSPEVKD